MSADGDLLYRIMLLEFFKANRAFSLFELIHSLVILFLYDQSHYFLQSCLYLLLLHLLLLSIVFLLLHLVHYILFISSSIHTYSDYADHAYAHKNGKDNEEDHGNNAQVRIGCFFLFHCFNCDQEGEIPVIQVIQSEHIKFIRILNLDCYGIGFIVGDGLLILHLVDRVRRVGDELEVFVLLVGGAVVPGHIDSIVQVETEHHPPQTVIIRRNKALLIWHHLKVHFVT